MANSYEFKALWDRALRDYLRSTDRVLQDQAVLKQLYTTEGLMAQIEISQRKFGDWRNKHHRTFSILSHAMRPIESFAKIAQSSLTATPFAPTSIVFGAALFLVESANGESDACDQIEKLFDSLGEFTNRLEEYIKGGMNSNLQRKVVAILACVLEILGRSEKIIKDGRFKKFMSDLCLGKDEKVKASFDRLSQLVDDEERLVVAVTYATGQRIEGKTDRVDRNTQMIEERVNNVAASLNDATTERRRAEQNELLERALCTPAQAKNYALFGEYSEDVLQNSGEWLLAEPAFQEWIDRQCPLLWVTGGPGTGKSCLSTIVVSKLRAMYPQDPTHPSRVSVGYFYIKEHDQHLQDLNNILKSIALQISAVDSVFRNHAVSTSSTIERIASTKNIWQNLFLHFYRPDGGVENTALVVIDGLDEAPPKVVKDMLRYLEDLSNFSQRRPRLCFAIFGRPELAEYMTSKLQRYIAHIEIGAKNEGDIAAYVKKQMREVLVVRQERKMKSKKAASKLARELRDKIMAKADGMFFKVVLIMNQLYDKERVPSLFEAIEEAPPQLEIMIRRVLERLALNEDVNKDDLNEILVWVAYSKRPLAISELYTVLQQRTGKAYDALEGRLRGKFASLFKLSRIPGFEELPGEDADIDQDDGSLDFDLSSDEGEPTCPSGGGGPEVSKGANEPVENEKINSRTLINLYSTDVRFTHASIRDFLVKEGESNTTREHGSLGIGINTRTAELHLASTCIKNIFEWNPATKNSALIRYSTEYFMDHLLSIEASRISRVDKQPLIRQLYCLFHDEAWTWKLIDLTYYLHNKNLYVWFADSKFSASIRKDWLAYALESEFSPGEYEWLQKAADSDKEFFRPLAMTAARMWLTKSGHDDQSYHDDQMFQVWILHCYLNMGYDENGGGKLKDLPLGILNEQRPPCSSVKQLQALADFAGIEKTQHWHTCFAWTLLRGEFGEAINHFKKALEIDDRSWKAMQGLSRCYMRRKEYSQAIDFLTKAIELVPCGIEAVTASLHSDLTKTIIAKGDAEEAIRHSQERYAANPRNVDVISDYIKALYAGSHYDRIVDVVEDIRNCEDTPGRSGGRLLMLLTGFLLYDELGSALRARGRIDLVQSAVDELSHIHYFQKSPWVLPHAADFKFKYYERTDDAMAMLEPVIQSQWKTNLSPEVQWSYGYCYTTAFNILSQIYYRNAVAAKKTNGDPERWISKLIALATPEDGDPDGPAICSVSNASLLLGIWFRIHGNAENTAWKDYFRPSILNAVDVLEDEDPTKDPMNDPSAYSMLGRTLLSAGDMPNAMAALAVTLKPLEVSSCPSQLNELEKINFRLWWICDGPCDTIRTKYRGGIYKELHFCEECLNTLFCEDCIKLVKENKLPIRKCSPEHTFVQVFPVPEGARDVAARFEEGLNAVVVQKEWLDSLRKDWS